MNNQDLLKHATEDTERWKDALEFPQNLREHANFQLEYSQAVCAAIKRLIYLEYFTSKWVNNENGYQDKLARIRLLVTGVTPYANSPFGLHDPFDSIRAQARCDLAREILDILEDKV